MAVRPTSPRRRASDQVAHSPRRHIPQLLREIGELFGAPMAAKLARRFGGQYVYLPLRALPSHPIAKATSLAVLAWLIQRHDVQARIVIPSGSWLLADDRIAKAAKLRAGGMTVAEIASRVRVHVRTAHTYLRLARERGLL